MTGRLLFVEECAIDFESKLLTQPGHHELQTDRPVRLVSDRLLYDHRVFQIRKSIIGHDQLAIHLFSAIQPRCGVRVVRGDEDDQRVP